MALSCPQCGGAQIRQITPGLFECASQIDASMPPGMAGNPTWLHASRPCRHRFQISTPGASELCACGRQSIGICQDCKQSLCGLHGTDIGAFLCAECLQRREESAEAARATRYGAEIAVVRKRAPIVTSIPATLTRPPADIPVSRFGQSVVVDDFDRAMLLWADGLRQGFPDLLGLAWTDRFSGQELGEAWHLVHHYTYVRRGRRTVRRLFHGEHQEEYIAEQLDSWTAYGYFQGADRLCAIRHFRGRELLDHWRHLGSHASGNRLYDFRWEPASPAAPSPPITQEGAITLSDDQPLFQQLVAHQRRLRLESWAGLTWTGKDGRRRRIADDPMVQRNYQGDPPAYRVLVVDTLDGHSVVDRDVSEIDSVEEWLNAIGRDLGEGLVLADVGWT
jgi:hypothetical protein